MARSRALLSFEWAGQLPIALANLPAAATVAVTEVVARTVARAERIAKNRTPVDSGRARNGWRGRAQGLDGKITNDVAYINVLEFGGYPVTPASHTKRAGLRRGRAILGGRPPPQGKARGTRQGVGTARTKKAPGGNPRMRSNVSKQAERGMVRSTLEHIQPRFLSDLTDAINSLPGWG